MKDKGENGNSPLFSFFSWLVREQEMKGEEKEREKKGGNGMAQYRETGGSGRRNYIQRRRGRGVRRG